MAEKEPEVIIDESQSDPPLQGPSNVVRVVSKKGKVIVVKREGDQEIEYEQELEKPDLREFKLRPIERFKEAAQRNDVVGITMEKEYDEITESDEEREVAKLSKEEQKQHQEMKDLMSIQGRLKGQIPGFAAGIQAYVTRCFPGVPSELAKPYVIEETGEKADLLTRMHPAKISDLIQEHDQAIPRRDVVVRPGRRGIALSIDPNSDDEIYEINTLEDSIGTVIKLTRNEASKQPVITGEKASGATEVTTKTRDQPSTTISISTTDDRVLVPDIISQAMADDYTKEEKPEEEDSNAETISSTSTANYNREEAEDLLDKIISCHTALATHYNKMNEVVPHMTKMQLVQYLSKVHILNIVKTEGIVSKTYTGEPDTMETKFLVHGETQEERLQGLVDTVPAHQLMLAIAIGDIHLNKLSYDQALQKHQISKSRIQRAISGKAEHKKGGKQYELEEKRKKDVTLTPEAKAKKAKTEKEQEQEEETPQLALFPEQVPQDILPDLINDNDDDTQFPIVDI